MLRSPMETCSRSSHAVRRKAGTDHEQRPLHTGSQPAWPGPTWAHSGRRVFQQRRHLRKLEDRKELQVRKVEGVNAVGARDCEGDGSR